jgi:hypothetical protein
MRKRRSLLLLSCSREKQPGGVLGRRGGRSFAEILRVGGRGILEQRTEIRRMLRGGPPRINNQDQKGGFRDERSTNRNLANGPDFGGSDVAAYLPACKCYTGRFFDELLSVASGFWDELPPSIEIIFVSGLYGLVFWDEMIQNYDCHFADQSEAIPSRKVSDLWSATLTDALIEFLHIESRSNPITTIYDLLSERLYQNLFVWNKIQGAGIYHRIFRGVAGPDILAPLGRIVASNIFDFAQGGFKEGWYREGALQFGFEAKVGGDRIATREGDIEKTRNDLLTQYAWFGRVPEPLRNALIVAELSWQKARDLPYYEWGGLVVSFANPVERFLKDRLGLFGKETLGDVIRFLRGDPAWRPVVQCADGLNSLFIRAKHTEPGLLPIMRPNDVSDARRLAFEILRFGTQAIG